MRTSADTTTDTLTVHRAVMHAAGPDALAGIARPLTGDEAHLLDAWLGATFDLSDHGFAAHARVPLAEATAMRRLLAAEVTR